MAIAFTRSMRSLHAGNRSARTAWFLLLPSAVLIAWSVWFVRAPVARYEVTDRARLEVDRAVYVLQAPIAGRVISSALSLGRGVKPGDVLLEIEAQPQQLQLRETRAHAASLDPQIRALLDEIAAQQDAQRQQRDAARAALDQARAQFRETDAQAKLAADEAARIARLRKEGLIAERDLVQAQAAQQSKRAAADSAQFAIARLEREQQTAGADREAGVRQLRTALTKLEADRNVTATTVERLSYEVRRRRVIAPVDGKLGEVAVLRPGGWVDEGDKVGAVVPSGHLRVVAEFPPPAALGRIRAGQTARVRLQGFPWTQYGTIAAHVASVGSEVRDGFVRVELDVDRALAAIPLQHGLPGSVEIKVEDITPAALVLRAAGQLVSSPRTPFGRQEP